MDRHPIEAIPASPLETDDAAERPSGPLVGRTQLARILGVSPSTVIRHVEGQLIQPIVDDRGHHRFALDDIESIRHSVEITRFRRSGASSPATVPQSPQIGPVDRDTYVAILELLDVGTEPIDIAKKLRLFPSEIDPVVRWWTERKGAYFVSREQADEIWSSLGAFTDKPNYALKPKDGAGLERVAREAGLRCNDLRDELAQKSTCTSCKAERAMYCPGCAKKRFGRRDS